MKLSIHTKILLAVFALFTLAVIIIIDHADISLYLFVVTGTGSRDDCQVVAAPHATTVQTTGKSKSLLSTAPTEIT